jgi:hypothetical protein
MEGRQEVFASVTSFWHPSYWLVALHQNKEGLMLHVSCLLEPYDLEIRTPTSRCPKDPNSVDAQQESTRQTHKALARKTHSKSNNKASEKVIFCEDPEIISSCCH